ncbi:DUF3306 domain-containing protein [Marivita sp. GX14005]|uniref:DUF3306 domain-containing protein n=1 Tax=Marivita sp. GX14005 TaxID=2942276 RepID=UPI0020184813|nr:DUF3306 domain-containing protein [Marivita sp. GX14005]MCL3881062.1 DUF3306 domain-containing protein [Marivita sp. GX14005]
MTRNSDFWSRRKRAVEAEEAREARDAEEAETRAARAELEDRPDEEILQELGLPDPDALEPGQDISAFMQKIVPDRLRQRALRRLWRINPALANLDGLCDYNDDFTNAATDAPGVVTAYRVGQGLLKHIAAQEVRKGKDETEPVDTAENLSDIEGDCKDSRTFEEAIEKTENMQENANDSAAYTTKVVDVAEYADGTPSDTIEEVTARPRRMRFRLESDT